MAKKLDDALFVKHVKGDINEKEITFEGTNEIYGKYIPFLGVAPFLADYGVLFTKTYLVLPHLKEKFYLIGKDYVDNELTITLVSKGEGIIEPLEYMRKSEDKEGEYMYPPFISIPMKGGLHCTCSTRYKNSEYIEIPKNVDKVRFNTTDNAE